MRIVFMGTPDFAEASLKKLLDERFDVAAVYTQPDRPRGRGMALSQSPVKQLAIRHDIPVFQPETLRGEEELEQLRSLRPDILVVVAYGRILPEPMLSLCPYGAINVHASLLPKYRGSAPIQWAVLNGDETTGVTTMYLAKEMDAGDIIFKEETKIGEKETSGELFDRLSEMGAALLVKTLRTIEAGTAPRAPQDHTQASYVSMLDKSLSPIDWSRSPREIMKWICGLQPWPVATMRLKDETFRVFDAEYSDRRSEKAPGTILSAGEKGIEIACGDGGSIQITELQAPGKKRMAAADFLRGHTVSAGETVS